MKLPNNEGFVYHENKSYWGRWSAVVTTDGSGIVTFSIFKGEKNGFISDLSVAKPFRRKGIARKLINECFEIAKLNKCKYVYLLVEKDRHWLQEFYARLGFKKDKFRGKYHYRLYIKLDNIEQ